MKTSPRSRFQHKETKDTKALRQGRRFVPFVGFCSTLLLSLGTASAATRYVWQGSPSPAPPYGNWTTAAHVIQDAVDAAQTGDTVLVAGGVYDTGGRAVGTNQLVNRVAIDRAITVESLMGAEVTIIQGYQVPGTTNGDSAIRCVYLADGASLSGFTLTNGATRLPVRFNDYDASGGGVLSESTTAMVSNCVLTGNSAYSGGGGAYNSTLNNCTLTGNVAGQEGGGAYGGTLSNCIFTGNSAGSAGGGAAGGLLFYIHCTLINCTLTGNSARYGGGAAGATLICCTLAGNSAIRGGGAGKTGPGALAPVASVLTDCTLFGNSAEYGGGADESTLNNCIIYYNSATNGANYYSLSAYASLNYCCTTPMPTNGTGDITNAPLFVDYAGGNLRLQSNSPCINAGNNAYVTSPTDLDGNPRIVSGVVDIGAYEFQPSASVRYVNASNPNPAPPYTTWATAARVIQDTVDAALPGEEIVVTNGLYATGGRTVGTNMLMNRVAVDKPLTLRSVNGPKVTIIQGDQVPGTTNGDGAIRCVYLANGASLSGFTLTHGATRKWPEAPDYGEQNGGGVWCESTNAFVVDCVLTGNSAAGDGGGAFGGTLNYCTLIGNLASWGGGVAQATLNSCTLIGNSAGGRGGGAAGYPYGRPCILNNCTLAGNSASYEGGGVFYCTLNHCTVTGNSASESGGGASGFEALAPFYSSMTNCIVYFNAAPIGANYDNYTTIDSCCTTPVPTNGVGNITNAPLFLNYAGGNLRLQSNSPCINAGNNAYVTSSTDLDGNPRIIGGTVDIGAYEYQGSGSLISYAWLQHYGLPTDGSADTLDADLDGRNTWQEWRCQTDPTNALSVLKLLPPQLDTNGTVVLWQSVLSQSYSVERATNASGPFSLLQGNIPGQAGTTSVTDTNRTKVSPLFYRVGVGD